MAFLDTFIHSASLHLLNCFDAMFKGKTIKVLEAYLVKDNGCTAENEYGKKMSTIKLQ